MQFHFNLTCATLYRCAIAFAICIYIAHILALPVGITYDGHQYIDMADVLFSPRFPHDWFRARTPLFPLALKFTFWFLGKQPLAIIFVCSGAALAGILVCAWLAKKWLGLVPAAIAVILLSLDPSIAAFGHLALTETGTFALFSFTVAVLLLFRSDGKHLWTKAVALGAVIGLGYYWRQNLISLAWPCGIMLATTALKSELASPAARNGRLYLTSKIAAVVLIVGLLPSLIALPFKPLTDDSALVDVAIRDGIIKQALLPPDDPLIRPYKDEYLADIEQSKHHGHLYSGLHVAYMNSLVSKVFSQPQIMSHRQLLWVLARKYPLRYLQCWWRTLLLFFGVHGSEDEIEIYRGQILSLTATGSKIHDGPEPIHTALKAAFEQRTTTSFILRLYARLTRFYDPLVTAGFAVLCAGLFASLWVRDWKLFAFCFLPIVYLIPMSLTLISVDRYGLPVHPIALLALVAVPAALLRNRSLRRRKAALAGKKSVRLSCSHATTFAVSHDCQEQPSFSRVKILVPSTQLWLLPRSCSAACKLCSSDAVPGC
jgi:hypothetical protein